MGHYLLIAGDNYYPSSGDRDWKKVFKTKEEAEQSIERIEHTSCYSKGKNKGKIDPDRTYYTYKFEECEYDWYYIVNLDMWIQKFN